MKILLSILIFLPLIIFSQEKCLTTDDIANLGDKSLTEIQRFLASKDWKYNGELSSNTTGTNNLEYDAIHKWEKISKDNVAEFILFKEGSFTKAIFVNFENKMGSCEISLFEELGPTPVNSNPNSKSKLPNKQVRKIDFTVTIFKDDNSTKRVISAYFNEEIRLDIPSEPSEDLPIPPYNSHIVDYPEVEAQYPGGAQEMKNFIIDNMRYPETSKKLGEQGRVFMMFYVNRDGSIEEIKVLRGVSKDIDAEAIRLVKSMSKWIPAQTNGENIKARARIPINFVLPTDK
jgi:TonB family protein